MDERPEFDGEKFIENYDIWSRQVSQKDAEYSPAGGLSGRPCATCRWFVSPDACVIVEDWPEPISSIGTSNRYEAKEVFEPEPMEVIIVGEAELATVEPEQSDGLKGAPDGPIEVALRIPGRIKDAVVSYAQSLMDDVKLVGNDDGMKLYREKDGTLRWFMWATNKWVDRETEIFSVKAHEEFIGHLDNGGRYPEAWLWHTPGTRWGVADWADYSDGFFMYSGTVDEGMEEAAKSLAGAPGLGVSHGFKYLYSDEQNGIIGWYRTYELSALPLARAANIWTGIDFVVREAKAMGMSDVKREFLVEHLGETKVAALEGDTEGMKNALDAAGIAWKDVPEEPDDKDGDDDGTKSGDIDYDKIAASAVKAIEDSPGMKAFGTRMDDFDSKLGEMAESIKALETTDDEKIAAKFSAKAKPGKGHQASADDDNVLAEDDEKAKALLEAQGPANPFVASIMGPPEA